MSRLEYLRKAWVREKVSEIHDDREFYDAVGAYAHRVWKWSAHLDDEYDIEPGPEELIAILEARIKWVKEHQRVIDRYLRKRNGPTCFA